MIMNTESMKIRIGGSNDIDLETLSETLNSTVKSLKIIKDGTLERDQYCKFIVKNVERGSFVIDIEQVGALGVSLFPVIESTLSIFKEAIKIKKFLKGEVPATISNQGNMTKIVANDGTSITVNNNTFNFYGENQGLEDSISNCLKAVSKDGGRPSLSYEFEDEMITIEEDEYEKLSKPMDVTKLSENIQRKESIARTKVNVIKPDLQNDTKWELVYSGEIIKASILDSRFLDAVHERRVQFSSMQEMDVELKVLYEADKNGIPTKKSKSEYQILVVYRCGNQTKDDFKPLTLF